MLRKNFRVGWFSIRISAVVGALCLVCLSTATSATSQNSLDKQRDAAWKRFNKVVVLMAGGNHSEAREVLRGIIKDFSQSEEVIRQAYCRLVYTYHEPGDIDGATREAGEALEKYPDLSVVTGQYNLPMELDSLYFDPLRDEMFGALLVNGEHGASVFLDSLYVGVTPHFEPYVRVGDHEMILKKSGRHDKVIQLTIVPAGRVTFDVSMETPRGWKWWATRVGLPVVAAATVGFFINETGGEDEPEPNPEPIGGPPPPPE